MQGLFLVIDRNNTRGLEHWVDELYSRGLPALILVDKEIPTTSPRLMRDIAQAGFEIGFSYNDEAVWDMDYNKQWQIFSRYVKECENCTGKKQTIFGTKFFSYNEATLQIAQKLGVKIVPARGTAKAEAVVYKPQEYDVRILSISNVPSASMGTGSLCDWSLYSRSESPADFSSILLNLNVNKTVVVSQTHLGGIKQRWWDVYQDLFNACLIDWQSLTDFTANPEVMPFKDIPQNKEAQYMNNAKPQIPLDQEQGFEMDRHDPAIAAVRGNMLNEAGIC